ncbi:MAG: hypothetical protein IJB64_04505 [Akkermansia sp.]|nr:hypothetical protein [Akkermansia sp.]
MKQHTQNVQMVIYLGSEIGIPFRVWHEEKQQWLRADALEYPRCLPHGGNYLTTEREHGYGGHVRRADGSALFDWFPLLYEVVTERPCTINIQAGHRNKLHRFTVRGQAHPAATTTNAPTH